MNGLEWKRRLDDAHLSPQAMYLLNHIREVMVEQGRQLTMAVKFCEELAKTVARFVDLHDSTQEKMRELINAGKEPGVDVSSVANDPETEH